MSKLKSVSKKAAPAMRIVSPKALNHSTETLLALYKAILKPRLIEEKMLLLLRQGKITKWFSGIGQEAIAVGSALALESDEYILPLHRNLGVFTARNIPLERLFLQFQGREGGFTKGRDRSFHFGTNEFHIVGMISHLGPQLCVADGIALANKLRAENKVTLVFSGEGGTSEGDFHEALNLAAVWELPVIFLIENNGYALSTPTTEQFKCENISQRGAGYGMEAHTIDGNDLLEVYNTVSQLAVSMRKRPRPVLLECMTFRMRGHEEASGVKYVPKELFEEWAKKDPLQGYEKKLLQHGVLNQQEIAEFKAEIGREIEAAIEAAFTAPPLAPDSERELEDVYAPHIFLERSPQSSKTAELRYVDAISDGLRQALKRFPELILMGQDVAEYGGVFKVTENFYKEFGKDRIRNTPLCESAVLGAALGLSVKGIKSVVEMQFADFVSCGFNQIVNNLAKSHYRWGQNADVVVRMPTGGGSAAGPFHSQSDEAWFAHVPGLKVVFPAFPRDAKGLLISAIEDPNPVIFFEHKALYRSVKEEVPEDYFNLPLGKARLVSEGTQASVITYGTGVHWALEVQKKHPEISIDILDLRSLVPLDLDAISESLKKTSRAIILHEATLFAGIGAEIAAIISEYCFEDLDAPLMRAASLDTPVPFAAELEQNFFPKKRFEEKLIQLINF